MRKFRFPLVEILIVILAGVLIWLLGYPQYEEKARINQKYQVRVNMYTLRAAIENYAAYNEGRFPREIEEIRTFFEPPINPYKNKKIEVNDIKVFEYDSREGPKQQAPDSKNGRMRGEPGGLAYGYYIWPGDSIPDVYGIIGFDETGKPLAEKLPSGELRVFTIYE